MTEGESILTFEARMAQQDQTLTIKQKAYVEGYKSFASHAACPYRRIDVIWEWERGFEAAMKKAGLGKTGFGEETKIGGKK